MQHYLGSVIFLQYLHLKGLSYIFWKGYSVLGKFELTQCRYSICSYANMEGHLCSVKLKRALYNNPFILLYLTLYPVSIAITHLNFFHAGGCILHQKIYMTATDQKNENLNLGHHHQVTAGEGTIVIDLVMKVKRALLGDTGEYKIRFDCQFQNGTSMVY